MTPSSTGAASTDVPGSAMAAEMAEQPAVLEALASRFDDVTAAVRSAAPERPAGVAFLARGSSDNAALLGRYAAELATGLPTCLLAPSIVTAYGRQPRGFAGWLVLALSQSGETPEVVDLAGRYQEAGATVVAITNDPHSALARAARVTVDLRAGRELAVPATKTVTAQLLATLAVVAAVGSPAVVPDLAGLPGRVAAVLEDVAPVQEAAVRLEGTRRIAVVARGLCYPAARETALKLQETTGVMAHAFSTADFRHGPIAVCGPDCPALLLAGTGPADADTRALRTELGERGATVVTAGATGDDDIGWPAADGATDCVLATVRGQQLALELSRRLGVDPDHPAGLRKVTRTH